MSETTHGVGPEGTLEKPVAAEQVAAKPVASGEVPVGEVPVKAVPVELAPVEPSPVGSTPVEPVPIGRIPVRPDPIATDPIATNPILTNPIATDPSGQDPQNETSLSTSAPLLLVPVRIETRFVTDAITTAPTATTTTDTDTTATATTATATTASATTTKAAPAAFVNNPPISTTSLLVRVYPDTISVSTFEPELTSEEVTAGVAYWTALWNAGVPPQHPDSPAAAWRALAGTYSSQRAAWIAQTMTPTNLAQRPAEPPTDPPGATAPKFPSPQTRASSYEQPPTAEGLPDQWLIVLERQGTTRTVRGTPIVQSLAVGLTPRDGDFPNGLPVDAGMTWLVDFSAAVTAGMGVSIPLSQAEATGGFDRILVVGVRDANGDQAVGQSGDVVLAQLLADHHYTDGFAVIPQGAPTNNTTDASSAFSSADPNQTISFGVEAGPPLTSDQTADGAVTAAALGIPASLFDHIQHADGYGTRNAVDMLTALWPATFGYFLDQLMDPVVSVAGQDAARTFALANARPRGPVPAFRLGTTPYGVLPATSLTALNAASAQSSISGQPSAEVRARATLATLVSRLLPAWAAGVPSAPHLGATADPDADLAQVLGMDASSLAFRARQVIGDDALWNMMSFLAAPANTGEEWWTEHLARGRALLDSLSYQTWDPRIIHTGISRTSYPVPYPTVQDAPLSETDALVADATLDGSPVNYIQWLAHAPMTDVWNETYPGTEPTSILYRVLRQSVLREYLAQAGPPQVATGVLSASALREVELVNVSPTAPTTTPLEIMSRPFAAGSTQTWAQFLDTVQSSANVPTPESPLARLADLRASVDRLASLPTAELDRLLTETLDSASHRLDVWITALATSLLGDLRAATPAAPSTPPTTPATPPAPTLHLGSFGWVENVHSAQPLPEVVGAELAATTRLDQAREQFRGTRPAPTAVRQPGADNGGFIQAPSMTQAAAGAVLRSGYLSHLGTDDEAALAIDLSSARTQYALWLLAGVRQGLSLGALTGFRFEEQLHEQKLDVYVQPFRDKFPLVGGELNPETANGAVLPPPQVVDGVALRDAWQSGELTVGGNWGAGLPASGSAAQTATITILELIDDMLAALSDVSIADGVYQIMRGNYARAGGIMDAVSRGDRPPDPDIVATPRSGLDVTHRLMLLFAEEPPLPAAWTGVTVGARAMLEPSVSNWVAGRLPDPATVRASVSWTVGSGSTAQTTLTTVSLRQLDVGPLDILALADASDQPQRSELENRILLAANPPSNAATVTIGYSSGGLPAGSVTMPDLLTAARALRDLIGSARPLDLAAFALPDATPTDGNIDLTELGTRVSALIAKLSGDITALQTAVTALTADPTDQSRAEALDTSLRTASGYGVAGAIPSLGLSGTALAALGSTVLATLQERLAAVPTARTTLDQIRAGAASVLGANALLVPHLTPPDAANVRLAFGQSASMQAADPQGVRRWMLQLAHVRPAVTRYDLAVSATRLLGAARPAIELAQLPQTPGDRWLGLAADAEHPPAPGRVALAALTVGNPGASTTYSGLLLDEWLDRIPAATTASGLAFHFDEPNARAPQNLLLAVCPDSRQTWDFGLIVDIVNETLDLAKARAVDLASVQQVGQILPALYFPFNLEQATPGTRFLEVAKINVVDSAQPH